MPQGDSHVGSPGLAAFQRAKSAGFLLAGRFNLAQAGLLFFNLAMRELAIVGVGGDVKVDIAVGRIGVAAADESFAKVDDLGDVIGGLGKFVDGIDAQESQTVEVLARIFLGQGLDAGVELDGRVDQLIFHVGDVDDPGDLETLELR